ncbi:MAG: hypothetical protein ACW99G_06060 [Candidatus Thorarchaeota archaeon]|jgi:hypothetical protein
MKKKWEVDFVCAANPETIREELNKLGKKGWELVSISTVSCNGHPEPIAWVRRELNDDPFPGCEHL